MSGEGEGVGFVLGIGADGSGATEEIAGVEQKFNSAVDDMQRMQNMSTEEMGDAWENLSSKKKRAIQEIAEADEQETQQQLRNDEKKKASASDFSKAVKANLGDLMVLRRAMMSTIGLASLGFMVGEWGNVSKAIADAALTLGGFDAGLRQMQKDAEAANLAAIDAVQEFTSTQYAALIAMKDIHAFQRERTKDELENTRASQESIRQYLNNLQYLADGYKHIGDLSAEAFNKRQRGDEKGAQALEAQAEAIKDQIDKIGGLDAVQKLITKQQDLILERSRQIQNLNLSGHAEELQQIIRNDHAAESAQRKQEAAAKRLARFNEDVDKERVRAEKEWDRVVKQSAGEQAKAFAAVQKAMRGDEHAPADLFTPLVDGVKKLTAAERAALPTEIQIAKVRAEIVKANPNLTRAEAETTAQRLAAIPKIQQEVAELGHLKNAHKELEAAIRAELGLAPEYLSFMASFQQAAKQSIEAVQQDMAGSVEHASAGLAALIGGRRAQAGVEMVWEIAKGVACLAEGAWPPNPAAIIGAGLHFEAAAQYGILAGKSSGHHSAGAGRSSAYSDRGSGSGRDSGGGRDSGWPPQTLAPGASGGSRFGGSGVVIIRGTQEFENAVAHAVNGAVSRGVNVTATSAQRGAPVGH